MSLDSWMDKFYPTQAEDTTAEEAAAHSLRKWRGLTKANLKKYGLSVARSTIGPPGETNFSGRFSIDSDSCALCYHHFDSEWQCKACPLARELGQRCDKGNAAPYIVWAITGDPRPMIRALERVVGEVTPRKKERGGGPARNRRPINHRQGEPTP